MSENRNGAEARRWLRQALHDRDAARLNREHGFCEHALARIRAQLSIEEKRKLADYVIDNSGTPAETERQVRELYAKLVGLR